MNWSNIVKVKSDTISISMEEQSIYIENKIAKLREIKTPKEPNNDRKNLIRELIENISKNKNIPIEKLKRNLLDILKNMGSVHKFENENLHQIIFTISKQYEKYSDGKKLDNVSENEKMFFLRKIDPNSIIKIDNREFYEKLLKGLSEHKKDQEPEQNIKDFLHFSNSFPNFVKSLKQETNFPINDSKSLQKAIELKTLMEEKENVDILTPYKKLLYQFGDLEKPIDYIDNLKNIILEKEKLYIEYIEAEKKGDENDIIEVKKKILLFLSNTYRLDSKDAINMFKEDIQFFLTKDNSNLYEYKLLEENSEMFKKNNLNISTYGGNLSVNNVLLFNKSLFIEKVSNSKENPYIENAYIKSKYVSKNKNESNELKKILLPFKINKEIIKENENNNNFMKIFNGGFKNQQLNSFVFDFVKKILLKLKMEFDSDKNFNEEDRSYFYNFAVFKLIKGFENRNNIEKYIEKKDIRTEFNSLNVKDRFFNVFKFANDTIIEFLNNGDNLKIFKQFDNNEIFIPNTSEGKNITFFQTTKDFLTQYDIKQIISFAEKSTENYTKNDKIGGFSSYTKNIVDLNYIINSINRFDSNSKNVSNVIDTCMAAKDKIESSGTKIGNEKKVEKILNNIEKGNQGIEFA